MREHDYEAVNYWMPALNESNFYAAYTRNDERVDKDLQQDQFRDNFKSGLFSVQNIIIGVAIFVLSTFLLWIGCALFCRCYAKYKRFRRGETRRRTALSKCWHAWCYGTENDDQDDDYFDDYPDSTAKKNEEQDRRSTRQRRAAPQAPVQYNSVTFQDDYINYLSNVPSPDEGEMSALHMKEPLPIMSSPKKTRTTFKQSPDQPDTVRSHYKTAREHEKEENAEDNTQSENVHIVMHETDDERTEKRPVLKKIKASNV